MEEFLNEYATELSYAVVTVSMFATTFLRGFQNKNVAGGYKKLAFVVGYAMAVFDVITISLVAKTGLTAALFAGVGAACGWVLSMTVHDLLLKRHRKELEKLKKMKKRSKQEERIRSIMLDELKEQGLLE